MIYTDSSRKFFYDIETGEPVDGNNIDINKTLQGGLSISISKPYSGMEIYGSGNRINYPNNLRSFTVQKVLSGEAKIKEQAGLKHIMWDNDGVLCLYSDLCLPIDAIQPRGINAIARFSSIKANGVAFTDAIKKIKTKDLYFENCLFPSDGLYDRQGSQRNVIFKNCTIGSRGYMNGASAFSKAYIDNLVFDNTPLRLKFYINMFTDCIIEQCNIGYISFEDDTVTSCDDKVFRGEIDELHIGVLNIKAHKSARESFAKLFSKLRTDNISIGQVTFNGVLDNALYTAILKNVGTALKN